MTFLHSFEINVATLLYDDYSRNGLSASSTKLQKRTWKLKWMNSVNRKLNSTFNCNFLLINAIKRSLPNNGNSNLCQLGRSLTTQFQGTTPYKTNDEWMFLTQVSLYHSRQPGPKSARWWQILAPSCLFCVNCTKFGQLIFKKIIKIVASRCQQILWLKCTEFDDGWCSAPDQIPLWELTVLP